MSATPQPPAVSSPALDALRPRTLSHPAASVADVSLVPLAVDIAVAVPTVRAEPLDRLPGTAADDPLLRLAAAWLVSYPTRTAAVYRRDLEAWAAWCAGLSVHPFAAERHHVDAWVRHLTTK